MYSRKKKIPLWILVIVAQQTQDLVVKLKVRKQDVRQAGPHCSKQARSTSEDKRKVTEQELVLAFQFMSRELKRSPGSSMQPTVKPRMHQSYERCREHGTSLVPYIPGGASAPYLEELSFSANDYQAQ